MEKFEQRHSIKLFKEVVSELHEIDKNKISDNPQQKDNFFYFNGIMNPINVYELGVHYKEFIENKAHNLGLKGVWIDLNDLSKDEGCYFRHCSEVFEGLVEFMVIKDKQ